MADGYSDKFIAYVDVLGFKNLLANSDAGTGIPAAQLEKALDCLDAPGERERFAQRGHSICPHSACVQRDLDFRVTQAFDSAVISAEISPAGVITLVRHCWQATVGLMQIGLLCRGYITRGNIVHTDKRVFGAGHLKALDGEKGVSAFQKDAKELGTPFIEVDSIVTQYVRQHTDACVLKMFDRFTKDTGSGVALFPFKAMSHKFGVGGPFPPFDPAREHKSNNNVRKWIRTMKVDILKYADPTNPVATQKTSQYIRALDVQLIVCDQTEENINRLAGIFPSTAK